MSAKIGCLTPALIALGGVCAADPIRPAPAEACAAFDAHVLTFLEEDGRAATVTGHAIANAMTALIDARAACYRGDYALGLDSYSRIDLRGEPNPVAEVAKTR